MNKLLTTTALMLSLAFSGAAYAQEGPPPGSPEGGPPPFMHEALSALPAAKADQFRETMKASHEKDKPLFEHMRALHKDMESIMTASQFDKSAFLAKDAEIGKVQDNLRADRQEALATALSQLSQSERKTLVKEMRKHMHERHPGMKHHGDTPPADAAQ